VFTEPLPRNGSKRHNIFSRFLIFHQRFFSKNSWKERCLTHLHAGGQWCSQMPGVTDEAVNFYAFIIHLTTLILTSQLIILGSFVKMNSRCHGRKRPWPNYRYHPSISVIGSRMLRASCKERWCLRRDSKSKSPVHKPVASPLFLV
jgi:hypothetical protein